MHAHTSAQAEIQTELVKWLNLSTQRTMDEFVRFIRKQEITLQQMTVLMHLHYHGSCEMSRLVEPLQIGKSAVSQLVERLVKMGYLERVEVAGDRRARLVRITAAAEQVVLEAIAARQNWIEATHFDMPLGDQKQMVQALRHLNQLFALPARGKTA
jgi:DNA-binding MarR family transcriptional regulator